LLIKYIKSVLWRVAKCLSYKEEARCLKVKTNIKYVPFTRLCVLITTSKFASFVTLLVSKGM